MGRNKSPAETPLPHFLIVCVCVCVCVCVLPQVHQPRHRNSKRWPFLINFAASRNSELARTPQREAGAKYNLDISCQAALQSLNQRSRKEIVTDSLQTKFLFCVWSGTRRALWEDCGLGCRLHLRDHHMSAGGLADCELLASISR